MAKLTQATGQLQGVGATVGDATMKASVTLNQSPLANEPHPNNIPDYRGAGTKGFKCLCTMSRMIRF